MHMQVILNVYLHNDDFLLKVTKLSSYVVLVVFQLAMLLIKIMVWPPTVIALSFAVPHVHVECLKNVFKYINFEIVIAYLYFLD